MPDFLGLALDPATHDLFLKPDGHLATVTDNEAIGQHTKQRLLFYRGEWFLDILAGTPWFQNVFVRPHDPVVIEAVIKREILDTPGIAELTAFDVQIDERKRSITVLEATALSTLDQLIAINPLVPAPSNPNPTPGTGTNALDFSDADNSLYVPLMGS
jgi:hypothetical protein